MNLPIFKLEEFWKKHEFIAPYLLCASDAEALSLKELLNFADPEMKNIWENLLLGYTETQGLPLLREEIAKLYTSIKSNQILTTAGAEEGIYCTMRTLLVPGDHVIVVTPCYQSLETLPKSFGAEITVIALNPKNHWNLPLENVRRAFQANTKLLILNYPHNPTGALLAKEVFEGMITLARAHDAYIFCDEMYRYLEVNEQDRLPAMADAYEKGISLFGMTKPFGLAGLRIGWLASRDTNYMQKMADYKHYTSICNSATSEVLAVIALRAKKAILEKNRKIMLENLKLLDQFFERHSSSLRWIRPESGSIGLVELLLPVSIDEFAQELVERTGVLIMPGSVFDMPGNFFRIGFGRKNMPDALHHFENYLESYLCCN